MLKIKSKSNTDEISSMISNFLKVGWGINQRFENGFTIFGMVVRSPFVNSELVEILICLGAVIDADIIDMIVLYVKEEENELEFVQDIPDQELEHAEFVEFVDLNDEDDEFEIIEGRLGELDLTNEIDYVNIDDY